MKCTCQYCGSRMPYKALCENCGAPLPRYDPMRNMTPEDRLELEMGVYSANLGAINYFRAIDPESATSRSMAGMLGFWR